VNALARRVDALTARVDGRKPQRRRTRRAA
jgi:hypothetical protein